MSRKLRLGIVGLGRAAILQSLLSARSFKEVRDLILNIAVVPGKALTRPCRD
jgi:hypothetical protein